MGVSESLYNPFYFLNSFLKAENIEMKNLSEEELNRFLLFADYVSEVFINNSYGEIMKKEKIEISEEEKEECFHYLEALRLSGLTNIFGATPYLQKEFKLSKNLARKVLAEWMDKYNELSKKYNWN